MNEKSDSNVIGKFIDSVKGDLNKDIEAVVNFDSNTLTINSKAVD